jgi:hypothetical protein
MCLDYILQVAHQQHLFQIVVVVVEIVAVVDVVEH